MFITVKDLKEIINNLPDDAILIRDDIQDIKKVTGFDIGYLTSEQVKQLEKYQGKCESSDIELEGGWDDIGRTSIEGEKVCLIMYITK